MSETIWARRCLIIPASIVKPARNLAAALAPAGAGMFETPCSPTGTGAASHYITEGLIDAQFAALLPLTTITPAVPPATQPTTSTTPGNATYLWGACQQGAAAQKGFVLSATLSDAQALMAQGDVSEQDPFAALARLGLQLVSEVTP